MPAAQWPLRNGRPVVEEPGWFGLDLLPGPG
jgi:hypothetical protein